MCLEPEPGCPLLHRSLPEAAKYPSELGDSMTVRVFHPVSVVFYCRAAYDSIPVKVNIYVPKAKKKGVPFASAPVTGHA